MTKLAICSDLHVEFGDIDLKNEQNADILILAGDICQARDLEKQSEWGDRTRNFFQRVSAEFPRTIYVTGNHEVYGGDFAKVHKQIRSFCDSHAITNITLLDKEMVTIAGYDFIGGTLWTDFNDMDTLTMLNAESAMNDYRGVKNTNDTQTWKFLPRHALRDHSQMMGYLQNCMDTYKESGRTDRCVIVITHHAPSEASVHEKYAYDRLMNGNFYTNLEPFIEANPQIQLWVHGHMHDPFDYTLGQTRVVCNPRGYIGYESRPEEFELQYIELL